MPTRIARPIRFSLAGRLIDTAETGPDTYDVTDAETGTVLGFVALQKRSCRWVFITPCGWMTYHRRMQDALLAAAESAPLT